jgi:hypothetical protein
MRKLAPRISTVAQTAAAISSTVMLVNSQVPSAGSNKERIVGLSHRHFDTHPAAVLLRVKLGSRRRQGAAPERARDRIGSGRTHVPAAADGR